MGCQCCELIEECDKLGAQNAHASDEQIELVANGMLLGAYTLGMVLGEESIATLCDFHKSIVVDLLADLRQKASKVET